MQRRNFRFLGLALLGAAVLGTAACEGDEIVPVVPPLTLGVSPQTLTMNVGDRQQISANVTGGATNAPRGVTFTSSNAQVATVDQNGLVTAVRAGTASITVTTQAQENGRPLSATVSVIVNQPGGGQQVTGISINPSAVSITAGDTAARHILVAQVQGTNLTNRGVDFRIPANDPRIRIVSEDQTNGTATIALTAGATAGSTTVTAVSLQDTTVRVNAIVTVQAGTPVGGNGKINIGAIISQATGQPVDVDSVFGTLNITMNVTPGTADSMRLFMVRVGATGADTLGTRLPCTRTFPEGQSPNPQDLTCAINTAQIDTATFAPLFRNGAFRLVARLYDANQVFTSGSSETLNLRNVNVLGLSVTTVGVSDSDGRAIGSNGLLWHEGNVVVTVRPVIFVPGDSAINAPEVCIGDDEDDIYDDDFFGIPEIEIACRQTAAGTTANTFTVTFPKASTPSSNGVAGVTAPRLVAFVRGATTVTGREFPGGMSNVIRLDNEAPVFETLALPSSGWINGSYQFSSTFGGSIDDGTNDCASEDCGANTNTVTFQAGTAADALSPVTNGGELAETATNNALIVQVTIRDVLGNTRTGYVGASGFVTSAASARRFGVDKTAPIISFTDASVGAGSRDNTAPAGIFQVTYADTGAVAASGFGPNPVMTTVIRQAPNVSGVAACARGDEQVNSGSDSDTVCEPVGDEGTEPVTGALAADANGYFTYSAYVVDQAGNVSPTLTRTSLLDTQAPSVGGIATPATVTGGQAVTFSTAATDNLDLNEAQPFLGYGAGAVTLQFPGTVLGTYGPDAFTTSATPSVTINQFVRSIENTFGGAVLLADSVGIRVTDQAFNAATANGSIRGAVGPTVPGTFQSRDTTFLSYTARLAPNAPATICNGTTQSGVAGQPCPTNPTSTTVQAVLTGRTGTFASPFQRVEFYRTDPATGRLVFIGTGSISVTDTGAERTITYTGSFNGQGLDAGSYNVYALGVDAQGRALLSNAVAVTVAED